MHSIICKGWRYYPQFEVKFASFFAISAEPVREEEKLQKLNLTLSVPVINFLTAGKKGYCTFQAGLRTYGPIWMASLVEGCRLVRTFGLVNRIGKRPARNVRLFSFLIFCLGLNGLRPQRSFKTLKLSQKKLQYRVELVIYCTLYRVPNSKGKPDTFTSSGQNIYVFEHNK